MKRFVIAIATGMAVGLVLGIGGIALDIPPWAMLVGLAFAALASPRLGFGVIAPRQAYRCLVKAVDPDWRPPEAAEPVTSPLLDRLGELGAVRDWDGLAAHLADDFVMTDVNGRRLGRRLYVRSLKATCRVYRDYQETDEVLLADPARPEVLYVRATTTGRPFSGPALAMTAWSRITLAPGGERVREIGTAAVVRVG